MRKQGWITGAFYVVRYLAVALIFVLVYPLFVFLYEETKIGNHSAFWSMVALSLLIVVRTIMLAYEDGKIAIGQIRVWRARRRIWAELANDLEKLQVGSNFARFAVEWEAEFSRKIVTPPANCKIATVKVPSRLSRLIMRAQEFRAFCQLVRRRR